MCQTITIRKFGACNHTVETLIQGEQLCLFGEHCDIVKHTHRIFQRRDKELCPDCKAREEQIRDLTKDGFTLNTGKSSHGGKANANKNRNSNNVTAKRRSLPATTQKLLNHTAQERLRAYLAEDLSPWQCKSLAHFVLQQPGVVAKGALVEVFGEGAGGWYGDAVESEFVAIAAKKDRGNGGGGGLRERMERGLEKGRALREPERRAAEERAAEEKMERNRKKREAKGKAKAKAKAKAGEEEPRVVIVGKKI